MQHLVPTYKYNKQDHSLVIYSSSKKDYPFPWEVKIKPTMISSKLSLLITVALMAATTTLTVAQPPSCASKLVPCAPYLNSTKPPASCCDPLREAVTKDLDCLCTLYENPTLLPSLGINVTQALALPKACNIPGDVSACKGKIFMHFSSLNSTKSTAFQLNPPDFVSFLFSK